MFCSKCGNELEEGIKFCPKCGCEQNFNSIQKDSEAIQNEKSQPILESTDDEDLMRAYITGSTNLSENVHHYEHYKKTFAKIAGGSKLNWNLGAFFADGWNLMYRKSFAWGIFLVLASDVFVVIFPDTITFIVDIIITILCGMFGDLVHYSRYKEILAETKRLYPNNKESQISYIAQKGGVKKIIIAIGIFFTVVECTISFYVGYVSGYISELFGL